VIIGYARTSTTDQVAGLEAQIRDLKALKIKDKDGNLHKVKIFQEQISSVDDHREQLEAAIDYCREDDILACTKLDRLARSVADVVTIEKRLRDKGASLLILDPAMDTSTPNGRLIFNVIASIAQFEREIMLTRQREGIAKAKADGKFKGRVPTVRRRIEEIMKLKNKGMSAEKIADVLSQELDSKGKPMKMTARSVYRVLAEQRAA
jgi:DNA invertase Pin-like site-specific DNA recombinase